MSDLRAAGNWKNDSEGLRNQVLLLEERAETVDVRYSGLVDLDLTFDLIERRLQLAQHLMGHPDNSNLPEKMQIAKEAAVKSILELERLAGASLSLDQTGTIADDARMQPIRDQVEKLLSSGGAGLLSSMPDPKKAQRVVRAITAALARCANRQREDIDPGAEDLIFADSMTLPVSQAALMVREEFIPELERLLEEEPGNQMLQKRIDQLEHQAEVFEQTRHFPRARPVEIEPGLLTDTMVGFTPTGEAVVRMRIPTISSTGNAHDRIREEVQTSVLRNLAGRGVSDDLDGAYKRARSVSSGRRGTAEDALAGVRVEELFREVGAAYPFIRRLENPEELNRLISLARSGRRQEIRKYLTAAAKDDTNLISKSVQDLLNREEGHGAERT